MLNWPRLIQISWQLYSLKGKLLNFNNYYIKPDNYIIPLKSMLIHGITNKYAQKKGKNIIYVLKKFFLNLKKSYFIIGHNIDFDCNIIKGEFLRLNYDIDKIFLKKKKIDTQKILFNNNKKFNIKKKWISLKETYKILYKEKINKKLLHNSFYDLYINVLCFIKLIYYNIIKFNFKINLKNFLNNVNIIKNNFFLKKKNDIILNNNVNILKKNDIILNNNDIILKKKKKKKYIF
ncbi:MAG: exonuclease domain-containing protein [Candidatus Shikimatogenerans bostrichidophilus]|nr:MAG: exonuclease domain-containing protein [Candidatus Shikimatogenerans bostrichidophilus]